MIFAKYDECYLILPCFHIYMLAYISQKDRHVGHIALQ